MHSDEDASSYYSMEWIAKVEPEEFDLVCLDLLVSTTV